MAKNETKLAGTDEVKASVLRGYVDALREMDLFEKVADALPADTRGLLLTPPLNTVWLPGMHIEHIANAVAELRGLATVRECGRRSAEHGSGKIARSVIEGLLRLFDASPLAIFTRYQTLSSTFCKGVEFKCTPGSPNDCVIEMCIPSRKVSAASMYATGGAYQYVLRLCNKTGDVTDPEEIRVPTGGAARYAIRWG